MKRLTHLGIEQLEDRLTPDVTTGVTWPDPTHLTLSFAPDGTKIGDQGSVLFSLLNQEVPTAVWGHEILRAVQTWTDVANIDVSVAADGGQAFGVTGALEGDSRFGDIRVGARPMPTDNLGTGSPFIWTGTTWAGDIVLNSNFKFSVGGNGKYDLFTIALHEAGHAFGLLHDSSSPDNAMYPSYDGAKSYFGPLGGLSVEDIANIQSLYGARSADTYDQAGPDDSMANAVTLSTLAGSAQADADIATLSDVDYYKFTVPAGIGLESFAVTVQTSQISSLLGSLTIYNAAGQIVGAAAATDPMNGNITVQVNGAAPLSTYYVGVGNNSQDAFGIGDYHLSIGFGPLNVPITPVLAKPFVFVNDLTNEFLSTATILPLRWGPTQDARFQYVYTAQIANPGDVHYYEVQGPATLNNTSQTMVAMVWGMDATNTLEPRIDVFDALGNLVPGQVLANGNGTFSVQITNAPSLGIYYLKVSALNPTGSNNVGDYFLGVNFHTSTPVSFQNLSDDTMSSTATKTDQLTMNVSALVTFRLTANTASGNSGEWVQLTIVNSKGNVVLSLLATDGQPAVTATVYLTSGQYTVYQTAGSPSGQLTTPIDCVLDALILSDPIGTYANDGSQNSGSTYSYC
jgi:hypothetical protein